MVKKVIGISFLTLLLIIFSFNIILRFSGYQSFIVISSSMHPAIPKYSLVYIKNYDSNTMTLEIGDIIAIRTDSKPLLHRIIEIDGDTIYTQGDANQESDSPITFNKVIGRKVFFIPLIGVLFISPYPWLILLSLIIIVLLARALIKEVQKNRGMA